MADVFTGITEDRPYRKGMSKTEALAVLRDMAERNELDRAIVELLLGNFEMMNRVRVEAQTQATQEYEDFRATLETAEKEDAH